MGQQLRVALQQNPPSTFIDANGQASGLFTELLDYIALQEGWEIEYVPLSFNESLDHLKNGQIDLMPNLARSYERSGTFIYNNLPIVPSYGQIFSVQDIETLQDLSGKRVGYVDNDIFITHTEEGFLKQIQVFNVDVELVSYPNYNEITQALNEGDIDAGVLNQLYGVYLYHEDSWYDLNDIHAGALVFAPSTLHFAFPGNDPKYQEYASRIDHHLGLLKADRSSVYYSLMSKYVYLKDDFSIPEWIVLLLAILFACIILLVTFTAILNRQVNIKTVEIRRSKDKIAEKGQKLQMALANAREGVIEYDLTNNNITVDENSPDILGYNFPGLTFSFNTLLQLVYEADVDLFADSFDNLFADKKTFHRLEFRAKQQNGDIRWLQIQGKTVQWDDQYPVKYIGTVLDIHERKLNEQAREQLVDELTGRNKELKCLYSISRIIADPLTSIRSGLESTAGLLHETVSDHAESPVRIAYSGFMVATTGFKESDFNFKSNILVNGSKEGEVEVAVGVNGNSPSQLSKEEINLVDSIAKLLGSMIDRKQLMEQLDESEIKEREKISRELHDSVQQTLTVASLNLKYVNEKILDKSKDEQLTSKMNAGIESVSQAIDEIRSLARELEIDFDDAVEKLIKDLKAVSDVAFTYNSNLGHTRLDHKFEIALFRITQEAVNNIIKHASASKSTIQLMKYPDLIILTIEDDGKGFSSDGQRSGYGLNSIRTRASQINGNYNISSKPGNGTSITIEIPLN